MKKMKSGTIIFISGASLNNNIWDKWCDYFTRKGFETHAHNWPFKDGDSETLRNCPSVTDLATLRLGELVNHFEDLIRKMPSQPILIGHGIGGLIVQLLLQKGLGAAGIVIHGLYPSGLNISNISAFKHRLKTMGLFNNKAETYRIEFKEWERMVANGMEELLQIDSYYDFSIPESKLVARDAFWGMMKMDYKKPHPPLLFIAGDYDRISPSHLVFKNFRKYRHKDSVTDYREYKNRNHLTLIAPGWADIASYILSWTEMHVTPQAPKRHNGQIVHISEIRRF